MKKSLMIVGLVVMAVLIVIAAFSLRGEPTLAQEEPMEEGHGLTELKGEIHVTGHAKAPVVPDTVILRLGAEAMSTSSVTQAHSRASSAMNAMLAALADSGVDTTTDVQTTHFNISPEYEWTDEGRRMVGYTATQGISVKVRDLDSVGMVIDSAIQAAGNEARFDGLNFVTEEDPDLRRELLQNAYQEALDQAERLAELAGLEIVSATSISTGFVGVPSITQLAEAALTQLDTAISPGQVDVSMSLQVTFATVVADTSATPEAMGN